MYRGLKLELALKSRRLRETWVHHLALSIAAVGALCLGGWATHNSAAIYLFSRPAPMHPGTATLFVILAWSLWLSSCKRTRASRNLGIVLAALLTILTVARLCDHLAGGGNELDRFLFGETSYYAGKQFDFVRPGMAAATNLCFILFGLSMFALHTRPRGARVLIYILTLLASLVAISNITGNFLYNVASLSWMVSSSSMVLTTAILFIVAAAALLIQISDSNFSRSHHNPIAPSGTSEVVQAAQQNNVIIGFGMAAFVLCAVGVVSYSSISQFIFDAEWDRHTYQVLGAIDALSVQLRNAEDDGRGYAITLDRAFLVSQQKAVNSINPILTSLQMLTADNPAQQARITRVGPLILEKIDYFNSLVQFTRQNGFSATRDAIRSNSSARQMDQIEGVLFEMKAEERRLLTKRLAETESNAHSGIILIAFGASSAIGLLIWAGWVLARDIARRARAEEALRASESLFRGLLESAPDTLVITDQAGIIELTNVRTEELFGYAPEQLHGQSIEMIMPGRMDLEGDHHGRRKDGSTFPVEVTRSPMQMPDGMRISSAIRDITIHKREEQALMDLNLALQRRTADLEAADEKLRQSSNRFQLLVDNAKEYAIFILDAQGRVQSWNTGAQRILGYTPEEIIGQPLSRFLLAENAQRGKAELELKIAAEAGQYEEDGWRIRKDGSRFWANVVIAPIRDSRGQLIGFSKITRDLTERVRAEERVRNFFTLSLEMLCIAGPDGYFKRLNPAWENTLGFTEAELLAKPFVEFVHPDDQAITITQSQRLAVGIPVIQFENRYRCKDGSYRWLLWKATASDDSQLIYAAATDITERKHIENAVTELNSTLQRQNAQLEVANKELETFSYSVSHDLRAPLRHLDGFSQAILEDYSDKLDAEGRDHLHRIRAASQRMGHLIDDLLNLARVTRAEMVREKIDLSKMAHEVVSELQSASPEREVEFVIEEGLVAQTDPHLLRIVLTNLLGNAWKFTTKQNNARIEFGAREKNGVTEYFTKDNGAGFDMNYSQKLFGTFQRLHKATEFPGTGIGLATVQRIIQRHGGHVWAEGKMNEGATFHFTLESAQEAEVQHVS